MDNAVAILKRIGLNQYETSIYIALLKNGSSSAGELSGTAEVPRSRVYDVLLSLEKKGFALAQLTKPVSYAPVEPDKLIGIMRSEYKREFDSKVSELESLKDDLVSTLEPLQSKELLPEHEEPSGLIKSKKNIHRHIENMFMTSKKSICKMGSHAGLREVSEHHHEHMKNAKNRGIDIKVMGSIGNPGDLSMLRKVSKVRRIDGIDSRFIIKDGKEALVLLTPEKSEQEIGLLVKNEYFARSMQQIFDHYWEHAKAI